MVVQLLRGSPGITIWRFQTLEKEEKEVRAMINERKRPRTIDSNSSKTSKLSLEYTPSNNGKGIISSTQADFAETQPGVSTTQVQPDSGDLPFLAVMQFYNFSKTAQVCYKTLSTKAEIFRFSSVLPIKSMREEENDN